MKEALYYRELTENHVECVLCPHYCKIAEGKVGKCKVRINLDGKLYSSNYDQLSAINIDPVEKKPLYHFYPGKKVLSIGSVGCNFKCSCCQNWEIAQTQVKNYSNFKKMEIAEIVKTALLRNENIGIAYTYNEPYIWYEYMLEVAKHIKKQGQKNIMVTNGFFNESPLSQMLEYIDAFNIDIKAFSENSYHQMTQAGLEPVKKSAQKIIENGKHLELTNLVIPGFNDSEDSFVEMINWIEGELGRDTVLHLSRYFPAYKMSDTPTPISTLERLYEIANKRLNYVYLGNVNQNFGQDTYCSKCGQKVISRNRYNVDIISVTEKGACGNCNHPIVKN